MTLCIGSDPTQCACAHDMSNRIITDQTLKVRSRAQEYIAIGQYQPYLTSGRTLSINFFIIRADAYTMDDIVFYWRTDTKAVELSDKISLPEYHIQGVSNIVCSQGFSTTGRLLETIVISSHLTSSFKFLLRLSLSLFLSVCLSVCLFLSLSRTLSPSPFPPSLSLSLSMAFSF